MTSKVREVPLIFSTESILAILKGIKTQTRRFVCKSGKWSWEKYLIETPDDRLPGVGKPGDLILTGENFDHVRGASDQKARFHVGDLIWVKETRWVNGGYIATDPPNFAHEGKISSLFMQKLMTRIWLKITDVRYQLLQEITTRDIIAEGILEDDRYLGSANRFRNPFASHWDKINAKHGYPWESNPWVVAVTFEIARLDHAIIPKKYIETA